MGKTAVVKHNLNPTWDSIHLDLDPRQSVMIKCFDFDKYTQDDLIGCAEVSVANLTKVHCACFIQ